MGGFFTVLVLLIGRCYSGAVEFEGVCLKIFYSLWAVGRGFVRGF